MHICGDTTEFLDLMIKCNIEGISLDQIMDYKVVAPKIPKDIVLIGNLDPIDILGRGTMAGGIAQICAEKQLMN